jgi:hypothetical protein
MFSVDLVAAARNLLRFVEAVRPVLVACLERRGLGYVCTTLYPAYLSLQKRNPRIRILPPPLVGVVHLAHMLQSKDYHKFAASFG